MSPRRSPSFSLEIKKRGGGGANQNLGVELWVFWELFFFLPIITSLLLLLLIFSFYYLPPCYYPPNSSIFYHSHLSLSLLQLSSVGGCRCACFLILSIHIHSIVKWIFFLAFSFFVFFWDFFLSFFLSFLGFLLEISSKKKWWK